MKKKKKVLHRQIHSVTMSNAMGLRVGGVVVPYYPSYWGGPFYSGFGGSGINYGSNTNEGASNANNSDAASNAGGGEGASLSY